MPSLHYNVRLVLKETLKANHYHFCSRLWFLRNCNETVMTAVIHPSNPDSDNDDNDAD